MILSSFGCNVCWNKQGIVYFPPPHLHLEVAYSIQKPSTELSLVNSLFPLPLVMVKS